MQHRIPMQWVTCAAIALIASADAVIAPGQFVTHARAAQAQQPGEQRNGQRQEDPARRRERRERRAARGGERDNQNDSPPADALRQISELQEKTKNISWDQEAQFLHQAHANIFKANGWTSEPDQFALDLLHQITNVTPWNPKQREELFLNGVQTRLGLTADQRQLIADQMRQESMQFGMKHFRTMFPIVMEAIQTRLEQKPYTPEQVQKWSRDLRPVMDDAIATLQRTTSKLENTMTDQQRQRLRADMDALLKRHKDVEKMVERWQSGQWNPTDWGLDNDPIHAAAVNEWRAKEANRNALAAAAMASTGQEPKFDGSNESEWRKYVQWFIAHYKCDERQQSQAESILKSCEKEAADYIRSRGKDIEKAESMRTSAESPEKRKMAEDEVVRLRRPIAEMFERLKKRLDSQVLTSEQRKLIPSARPDPRAATTAQAAEPKN
ncbi:MAG: hypothetical protein KF841_01690 [Phycisphaerae bacterium]|nr:hypothetical protein [Phycisphaerae bacterium]